MNPEAQLPIVYQSAANLYQTELFSLQLQTGGRVIDMLKLLIKVKMVNIYREGVSVNIVRFFFQ